MPGPLVLCKTCHLAPSPMGWARLIAGPLAGKKLKCNISKDADEATWGNEHFADVSSFIQLRGGTRTQLTEKSRKSGQALTVQPNSTDHRRPIPPTTVNRYRISPRSFDCQNLSRRVLNVLNVLRCRVANSNKIRSKRFTQACFPLFRRSLLCPRIHRTTSLDEARAARSCKSVRWRYRRR